MSELRLSRARRRAPSSSVIMTADDQQLSIPSSSSTIINRKMTPVQARVLKFARISCAVISCLLAAGPIFGFAALKPVLIGEGVYAEDCRPKEIEQGVLVCERQDEKLNFMFTVAAVATNVSTILVSSMLDRYGPRSCGILGSLILALGSFIMIRAKTYQHLDGYVMGYSLLGLAGPFILLSTFQLSNMFPQHSGLLLALFTGACDASAGLFLAYRVQYFRGQGILIKDFFKWYMIVPLFILLTEVFLMPHTEDYKTMGGIVRNAERSVIEDEDEDEEDEQEQEQDREREPEEGEASETTGLLRNGSNNQRQEIDYTSGAAQVHLNRSQTLNDVFRDPTEVSGVWGALHHLAASKQLSSPWFMLITLFTAVQMLVINYFIETVFPQYQFLLADDMRARGINEYFDVALPVGGIIAIPFIGLLLDNLPTLTIFAIITAVSTLVGLLGFIPATWAGVLRISLLVLYRPLYFTAVSDYSAKVFGFDTFGMVYGLILSISGMANWLMVYFDFVTHRMFNMNPFPVTGILTISTGAVGGLFITFVWTQSKHIRRKQLEDEARHAPVSHMPGGSPPRTANAGSSDCRTGECDNCVCEV